MAFVQENEAVLSDKKRKLLVRLLGIAILVSIVGVLSDSGTGFLYAGEGSREIRVMTFNIRYGTAQEKKRNWDQRKQDVADVIHAFSPDLLGTQETLAFQRDFLAGQLPGYQPFGAGRTDGKEAGEMAAIFWKTERFEQIDSGHFWLSPTPEQPGSVGWDAAITRVASWAKLRDRHTPAGKPILLMNTHLDHKGQQARVESARLIRERLQSLGSGCSVIVTGDFNTGEESPPYQALFGTAESPSPLIDAFRNIHPERSSREGTFNNFSLENQSGDRIDWVAISSDWKVLSAEIDRTSPKGETPSDHFPVNVTLKR